MTDQNQAIDNHYGFGTIIEKILAGLRQAGKDIQSLAVDDLAPIDEFHSRGRDSTLELTALVELKPDHKVLDVGCGLGGSARHLAQQHKCHVTGLDLTQEYIDVAIQLTEMVGLTDNLLFTQGSALDLPYEDASFDVVWTEHAQMNIADKQCFYSEIARVLRPGGCLLFHDIFQGEGPAPRYPVPWAEDSSISHLATEAATRNHMQQAGLSIHTWEDKGAESLQFFNNVFKRLESTGPPPIGIHLLMGDNAKQKLQNYVYNLEGKRIAVILGRVDKP